MDKYKVEPIICKRKKWGLTDGSYRYRTDLWAIEINGIPVEVWYGVLRTPSNQYVARFTFSDKSISKDPEYKTIRHYVHEALRQAYLSDSRIGYFLDTVTEYEKPYPPLYL